MRGGQTLSTSLFTHFLCGEKDRTASIFFFFTDRRSNNAWTNEWLLSHTIEQRVVANILTYKKKLSDGYVRTGVLGPCDAAASCAIINTGTLYYTCITKKPPILSETTVHVHGSRVYLTSN